MDPTYPNILIIPRNRARIRAMLDGFAARYPDVESCARFDVDEIFELSKTAETDLDKIEMPESVRRGLYRTVIHSTFGLSTNARTTQIVIQREARAWRITVIKPWPGLGPDRPTDARFETFWLDKEWQKRIKEMSS